MGTLPKPRCTLGEKGVATEDGWWESGGQAGKVSDH